MEAGMRVQRDVVRRVEDARGWLCEPLDAAGLAGQRNVHVVVTWPGEVRGNHLHRQTTEVLVVLGPALVRIREGDGDRDYVVPEGEVQRYRVPPGVAHAIQNTGTAPGWLVAFADREHDRAHPDTVRVVLLEGLGKAG